MAPTTTPAPPAIGGLVLADATTVSAWRPTEFPFLTTIEGTVTDLFRCWRELEEKVEIAYQVFAPPGGSYVILVGDLPRQRVEACAEEMLLDNRVLEDELRHDGELTIATTGLGEVYAAWRDRYVVLGTRDHVVRALARSGSPAWLSRDAIPDTAALATTAFVVVSRDPVFANVLGVPTTGWRLVAESPRTPWPERKLVENAADALARFGEEQAQLAERDAQGAPPEEAPASPTPPVPGAVGARVELRFASTDDARRAAQVLETGAFAVPLEPSLAAALAKLPRSISGSTLLVRVDRDSFAGVDMDVLEAWFAQRTGGN